MTFDKDRCPNMLFDVNDEKRCQQLENINKT